MDRWPQRENFRRHLDDYRTRTGESVAQVATKMGVSESAVYGYCTRRNSAPSETTKKRAAALFGCSVTEFLDDPGAEIAGQDAAAAAELTDAKRLVAKMMFQDLRAEDLTDEQALAYYRAWKSLVDAGKIPGRALK